MAAETGSRLYRGTACEQLAGSIQRRSLGQLDTLQGDSDGGWARCVQVELLACALCTCPNRAERSADSVAGRSDVAGMQECCPSAASAEG